MYHNVKIHMMHTNAVMHTACSFYIQKPRPQIRSEVIIRVLPPISNLPWSHLSNPNDLCSVVLPNIPSCNSCFQAEKGIPNANINAKCEMHMLNVLYVTMLL